MEYTVISKTFMCEDTYIYRVKPKHGEPIYQFTAGQYVYITNLAYVNPTEEHPFSIASSPLQKDYLEFCIKVYGNWTKTLSQIEEGATVHISEPRGSFIWDTGIRDAVFLLGGIGISPIMSMLRTFEGSEISATLTMLYGNRTPDVIAYGKELETLEQKLPLHVVHIFSHLSDDHPWKGHRGFITEDIVKKETDLSKEPTFFIIGPPIFIEKMVAMVEDLGVKESHIRTEDISLKPSH